MKPLSLFSLFLALLLLNASPALAWEDDEEQSEAPAPAAPSSDWEDEEAAPTHSTFDPEEERAEAYDSDSFGDDSVEEEEARPSFRRPEERAHDDWTMGKRDHAAEERERQELERRERLAALDEAGFGFGTELTLGAYFAGNSMGSLDAAFALGFNFDWQLGRLLAPPELDLVHRGLWLEFAFLHVFGKTDGTEAVNVSHSQNNLSLAVLFGYPFEHLLLYGKFGPVLYLSPVSYDIQGELGSWTVARGGVVYGVGLHSSIYFNEDLGLSLRLEVLGHRRAYYNDLQVTAGAGLAW